MYTIVRKSDNFVVYRSNDEEEIKHIFSNLGVGMFEIKCESPSNKEIFDHGNILVHEEFTAKGKLWDERVDIYVIEYDNQIYYAKIINNYVAEFKKINK